MAAATDDDGRECAIILTVHEIKCSLNDYAWSSAGYQQYRTKLRKALEAKPQGHHEQEIEYTTGPEVKPITWTYNNVPCSREDFIATQIAKIAMVTNEALAQILEIVKASSTH